MVFEQTAYCPRCGGVLRYYDRVSRIKRTKKGEAAWLFVRRLRCVSCQAVHRELPDDLLPYKQYEAEIIQGVIEGLITCKTIGYEDYPCEMTMIRWIIEYSDYTHK